MPSTVQFTLHTKIELKGGKKKYPQIGVIVKDEATGHLFGNIEMIPSKGWDYRFYMFIPKKRQAELEQEIPEATEEPNVEEQPF